MSKAHVPEAGIRWNKSFIQVRATSPSSEKFSLARSRNFARRNILVLASAHKAPRRVYKPAGGYIGVAHDATRVDVLVHVYCSGFIVPDLPVG